MFSKKGEEKTKNILPHPNPSSTDPSQLGQNMPSTEGEQSGKAKRALESFLKQGETRPRRMKRTIPWSAKPTAVVEARLASLHGIQRPIKLFLVQTLGPTLFIVRHETTPSNVNDNATDTTTTTTTTDTTTTTTDTDNDTTDNDTTDNDTDNDTAPPHPPTRTSRTSRKYKVAIGNPQRCTCGDRSICIHILFCMTKVLGVRRLVLFPFQAFISQ